MTLPPTLERRARLQFGIAVGVLVVGAAALGWRAGETLPPPPSAIAKDPWSLGPLKNQDTAKDVELLRQRRSWNGFEREGGPQQAATRAPAAAVPWRLAGIVRRGDESLVLISTGRAQTTKFEYRRVGDALPDGSILVQIMSDGAKTQSSSSGAHTPSGSGKTQSTSSEAHTPSDSGKTQSPSPETHIYRLFHQNP
jgi:hypothetical protein